MWLAVEYTLRDWIALILIERASLAVLVMILFQAPIGDYLRGEVDFRNRADLRENGRGHRLLPELRNNADDFEDRLRQVSRFNA